MRILRSQIMPTMETPRTMELVHWFTENHYYYILPNRIYYLLGAQVIDSKGEDEWYALCKAVYESKRWRQSHPSWGMRSLAAFTYAQSSDSDDEKSDLDSTNAGDDETDSDDGSSRTD